MSKLNWDFNTATGEQTALYRGLRIRAVHDEHPSNPFKEWDGHWPMTIYNGERHHRNGQVYSDEYGGPSVGDPVGRITDAQLVFDQHALLNVFGTTTRECSLGDYDDEPCTYSRDPEQIRGWLYDLLDNVDTPRRLGVLEELYDLLGIPAHRTTSRGYCQGDWAEVLVVATPEAQEKLRPRPEGVSDEEWKAVLDADMAKQVDLFSAWAWGDCYGYIVEESVSSPDDEDEWVEIDDGSCWGYYGDHGESGLEDAAIETADAHLARRKQQREERLKTLLRNRVPLAKRAQLLEAA